MRRFMLATLLAVAPPAWGQPAATAGYEELREQGVLYFNRGQHKQARTKLDQAMATPQGQDDFRTVYYHARLLAEELEFGPAVVGAVRASKLAKTDAERREAEALRLEIEGLVGPVELLPARDGPAAGRIELVATTGAINPKKQQIVSSTQTRLRTSDVALPLILYLPYGDYTANGVAFSVAAGEQQGVTVPLTAGVAVAEDDDDGGGALWWYVGGGVVTAAALGVGAYFLFRGDEPAAREPELRFRVRSLDGR